MRSRMLSSFLGCPTVHIDGYLTVQQWNARCPGVHDDIAPWLDRVHHGDCLKLLPDLPDASVDMVLADLPYGTTRNSWDSVIDLEALWAQYRRVTKPGAAIVLTAAQPFTSVLVASNPAWFRYEWIWSKTVGSGQMNARRQPLRTHESVLVFYSRQPVYNPQMAEGAPYRARRSGAGLSGRGYSAQRDHEVVNTGQRLPKSVLAVPNPRVKGGHPTQKPVALFEYLVRTYTEPGQVVLDNAIGSGTTAVAAVRSGRHFIGMDSSPRWAHAAAARAAAALADPARAV